VKEKVSDRRAAAPVCEFIEKNKQLGGAQRARKGRGTWGGAAKTSSRVFRQMRAHRLPFGAQFRFRFQFKFESQFRFHFLPTFPLSHSPIAWGCCSCSCCICCDCECCMNELSASALRDFTLVHMENILAGLAFPPIFL